MSQLLVITGPTASGKGAIAFEVAQRIDASIVSVDSMKIYREMDIVTAKPSAARRRECRYHLIDLVTPDIDCSVGEYLPRLEEVIRDEQAAGRTVVLCGGSALYLKAFLGGFARLPGADWQVRERILAEIRECGLTAVRARLRGVDPRAEARISPEDARRVVRALEVWEVTGRRISDEWGWASARPRDDVQLVGVGWERPRLYARIDRRVLRMVDEGLFEEVDGLMRRNPPLGRNSSQCIGVREIRDGLAAGQSRAEVIEAIQQSTRNFAKRQMTWFRKMPIEWLPVSGELDLATIAAEVLRRRQA